MAAMSCEIVNHLTLELESSRYSLNLRPTVVLTFRHFGLTVKATRFGHLRSTMATGLVSLSIPTSLPTGYIPLSTPVTYIQPDIRSDVIIVVSILTTLLIALLLTVLLVCVRRHRQASSLSINADYEFRTGPIAAGSFFTNQAFTRLS